MINYAGKIPKESIIDVYGKVSAVPNPVQSTSIQNFEISVKKIFIVSRVNVELPFQVDAAARSEEEIKQNEALAEDQRTFTTVLPDTKLDYRWIDLRTPANQVRPRAPSPLPRPFSVFSPVSASSSESTCTPRDSLRSTAPRSTPVPLRVAPRSSSTPLSSL